jgi:Flp pilus assembly protein TadD
MLDRFWSSEEYDERAHTLYNEGDYDGALETLKEGLALYPNAVELYVGLGHARLAREEFAWARLAFERALILDPEHEDAMVGMGEVLLRLGRRREGIELFRQVEALGYEDDLELMLTIGRALHREGLFVEARQVFTRLAAARPDSADPVACIGYTLHRMGDETEACRHLRRALRIDPDLREARTYLGHLLYDRGDWESSLREFERVPPSEHWDSLAVWRVIELKRALGKLEHGHPALSPWNERLGELESMEWDPVEEILAEVEAGASDQYPWNLRDESQLELFVGSEGRASTPMHIRLPGGQVIRGNSLEVVRQFRDQMGFAHEGVVPFMRRMAERWHEQYGFEVSATHPEGFLRSAAAYGLLQLIDSGDSADEDPRISDS